MTSREQVEDHSLAAVEEERDRLVAVLTAQAELQELYIRAGADRAWWDAALRTVIGLSGSKFGFVGRIEHDDDGSPYLHSLAITDIAWNEWSRQVFDQFAVGGLEFRNLKSLFGVTVSTGELLLSDDPATDPRRCGLPPGHPPLDAYMGIPLHDGDELIGMVGVANRPGGYEPGIAADLAPVLSVISTMVARDRAERRAEEAAATAAHLEDTLESMNEHDRRRAALEAAVGAILSASSVRAAEAAAAEGVASVATGAAGAVLTPLPDEPSVLVNQTGPGADISIHDCRAMETGRVHVTMPGLRLDACPHADPLDALTVCCPIADETHEFGLLVMAVHEAGVVDLAAHALELTDAASLLATSLAQVAIREAMTSRALRDPLTGLMNRTALTQAVDRRLTRIDRDARPFAILILDLDDFKDVNDQLGHAVGDEVLVATADALQRTLRGNDEIARLGGDEFVVILDSGDPAVIAGAGQRLIESLSAITPGAGPGISASVGAVPVGWGDVTWQEAYESADAALYEAKAAGKGQTVCAALLGEAEQA